MCLFKNTVGIPCPGCGMTRALLSVLKGDLITAFYYHPLWVVVILYPVVYVIFKIIKPQEEFEMWKNKWLKLIIKLFIFIWIIRMIFLFPDTSPLNFNENSLMWNLFKWFLQKQE